MASTDTGSGASGGPLVPPDSPLAVRATNADGVVVESPSSDDVLALLTGAGNEFVIVERVADSGEFAQVGHGAGGAIVVERRESSTGDLFQLVVDDVRDAHHLLVEWILGRAATSWR